MAPPQKRSPARGEIWWVSLPTDPPDKNLRPVIIVSLDARNRNDRANSVLVVPLTTTAKEPLPPTWVRLTPGETGLAEVSSAKAEDVTVVRKESLREPRHYPLRQLSHSQICRISDKIKIAMGC